MSHNSWHRDYISALLVSNTEKTTNYETVDFLRSIDKETPNGVYELLLHRTIAQLSSPKSILELLVAASAAGWKAYEPRIVAKLPDLVAIREQYPEYAKFVEDGQNQELIYSTYSVRDYHLISNDFDLKYDKNSSWTRQLTDIDSILGIDQVGSFGPDEVLRVLHYYFDKNVRIFQLAIITFASQDPDWSNVLHDVLAAPYIHTRIVPARGLDKSEKHAPITPWAPSWLLYMGGSRRQNWKVYERQTQVSHDGQGDKGLREQITILLSVSGLLRDGIMLAPIESKLLSAPKKHPIWGFGDRQFVAGGTGYHANDIRALALAYLEQMPASTPVSEFRSRLAFHFVSTGWAQRKSATAVVLGEGFYSDAFQVAKVFTDGSFDETIAQVDKSPYQEEPFLQHFRSESVAASQLFSELETLSASRIADTSHHANRILCVAHASLPHQNGGYALRAHGILRHLIAQGVDISAVTRPGFPHGAQTEERTELVDDVEYARIGSTHISRAEGEIQHILSLVEPFEKFFRAKGIGKIHVRSTYLIALPALIAARRLGLSVLYEVSGLWELVYQESEERSQPLKRSSFAELAEVEVMTNADQVVVMNDALREIAIRRGVEASRITIAHNAVDTDTFQPLGDGTSATFTIGYIGNFVSYEGLGKLVDAVKILFESSVSIRLVAVGDGIGYGPLKKKVMQEGLQDIIDLPGRVPHHQVIDYYKQMDVLVYPRLSTYATEAITPLKPFEALALGKPIIVSDVKPLREIVGNNERGLVFESGNASALASCIRRLAADSGLQSSLGSAGRQWVVENRNWGSVVRSFIDAYATM